MSPTPSDRPRLQAERLTLSITTVTTIVVGVITLLTTTTVGVGMALNRLSNNEAEIGALRQVLEKKATEVDTLRQTVRELQLAQSAMKAAQDDQGLEIKGTSFLTTRMCMSSAWARQTNSSCEVKSR